MSSDKLEAYRHSGKYTAQGLLLPIAAAAIVAYPLGLIYSLLIGRIPFIYVNVLITLGYGFLLGWITRHFVRRGLVRHPGLALLCGALAGAIGLYFDWNGHLRVVFQGGPWLYLPDEMANVIPFLYEQGSWGLKSGGNVTGLALVTVWAAEAAMIIGVAAYLPWRFVALTPFSEKHQVWLEEHKTIDTLHAFTDAAHLAALKAGDLLPLTAAKPRAEDDAMFTRLTLKRSSQCDTFCTVRVQNVTLEWDKKGNVKEKVSDLSGDLVLPASMFELMAQFELLKPTKS